MTLIDSIRLSLPQAHPWRDSLHWFPTLDSTNNHAKTLARAGAPQGTVVLADAQEAGRGRLGRSFHSPAGEGIYFSLILRPDCPADQLMHLTCAVATAAAQAIVQATGIQPRIKWTNDLVLGKAKVGGILTELSLVPGTDRVDWAIVGIGINCNQSTFPPEIAPIATSLALHRDAPVDRSRIVSALIRQLHTMSATLLPEKSLWMDRYRALCMTLGQEISLVRGDSVTHALALSIDDNGALVVRHRDGRQEAVTSGEVSVRGMYGYI